LDERLDLLHGRFGVIGAGAMGLSLAAALGASGSVTLVCREPALAGRIRADGARVRGLGSAHANPDVVPSISRLADHGPVHAVFVATKTSAIEQVASELRPVLFEIGPGGIIPFIVSFQNGIETGRQLMERLGEPRVLRMVLNYGARIAPDGAVEVAMTRPPHRIGRLDPAHAHACRALATRMSAGGLEAVDVEDIEPFVWTKGLINAAVNPVAALTDNSVGETLDSPARSIVESLLDEGLAVARADGIDLGPGARERLWSMIESARPHTPSMVEDIREGRTSEVGQLNRQVIAHGERTGVPTPTHRVVTALIDAFDWRVFRRRTAQRPPLA
jgi:2-dehydropantoate 2-reductase